MNIKNNQTDVICISSDEETVSSNLPYHKEHEVIEIKTKEQNGIKIPNNQVEEIIIKPETPDVQIIMTTVQTNNITPDTDSQKMGVKSERCEVQTIIQEVNLNTDHNGNSQQQINNNSTDENSIRVKVEEPESDIEDIKTVYSGSSERSHTITFPEATQNDDDDDDEILPPASAKRKRRKISSSSEVSDIERSKEKKKKRRRIIQHTESSEDEKKSSKSSNSTEFFSAESTKSSDIPVENNSTNDEDENVNSLENFRVAVKSISTEFMTTDTAEIVKIIRTSIPDAELPKLIIFLQQCCVKGLMDIGPSTSKKTILENFIMNTLSTSKQLRNRVVVPNETVQTLSSEKSSESSTPDSTNDVLNEKNKTSSSEESSESTAHDSTNDVPNEKDETSSSEESSESTAPDFTDDKDYECYLYKKTPAQRKTRTPKKVRRGMRELDKLKEDIDKSFIKPALLTLKPREHKKVDYGIDIKLTTSDDSDDFVNSLRKDKPESLRKKKYSKRRRISDSSSSRVDQDKNNDSDQSGSEIGYKRSTKAKVLEELDSDRTTPDDLVANPIDTMKNEACDDNRSTPDIDLENDPRVKSFESYIYSDENMDTDCSSGVTVQVSPRNESSSDDNEDENNPVYHFITVENITGCRLNINRLDIEHKPGPYKVYFENGVWKVDKRNTTPATAPEINNTEMNKIEDINADNVQSIFKDKPEVLTKVENDNIAPMITIKTSTNENEDVQEQQTEGSENIRNSLEDNLFYDPIVSDSDEDFKDEDNISNAENTEKQDQKLIGPLTSEITVDPLNNIVDTEMNSITEEKYMIQEDSLYDPISSDSEDDALHIDMETETKGKEEEENNKNKEQNNMDNIPNDKVINDQHPVTKDTISSDSEDDALHIDMETETKGKAEEESIKNIDQNNVDNIPNDKVNNNQHPVTKDIISSDSEDDALHIDMETKTKGKEEEENNKNKEQNNMDNISNDKVNHNQHPVTKDPISSDSEDDALHIDMETETKGEEEEESIKNKEQNNMENIPNDKVNNDQHPVTKDTQNKTIESDSEEWIIIEDSEEIAQENNIQPESSQVKPTTTVILENNQNSTLKELLSKNSNTPTIVVKPSNTQSKNTDVQRTPKKTKHNRTSNKCSPMSKLLTENVRKVLNLSYIACRGGFQYRCLNSCTYYNLKEDAFKYHILSRHGMDKWAGFCNLCGKSYSSNILSLLDEYHHMIDYHIKPEHEQRLNSKENVNKENDDNDSNDSDCIILSQPSESNLNTVLPEPIAIEKNENEAAPSVPLVEIPTDNIQQYDNTSSILDLPKSPLQLELPSDEQDNTSETEITDNVDKVINAPEVPVNTETNLENTAPKQLLRLKCLPGDKLSRKNSTSEIENPVLKAYSDLNPEMTFGELTELEMAKNGSLNANEPAVQESSSNQVSQPLSQIPEGCVPQTTPEQEATLLAVIEENLSRYVKIAAQPQQSVIIRAGVTLPTTVQPNSIILHTTSNALVTYTPPTMIYNNINRASMAQPVMNQSYQTAFNNLQYPSRSILPNQSYQARPTAAIAPSPKSSYGDLESRIPNTVIVTNNNNAPNSNPSANTMAPSANYMNTNQRAQMQVPVTTNPMQAKTMQVSVAANQMQVTVTTNPINAMQNAVSSIQNQIPGTSRGDVQTSINLLNPDLRRTRNMRPWMNKDDWKSKYVIEKCFTQQYLKQLYKCMFISCCFATDNAEIFRRHLQFHQQAFNNPNSLDLQCSYCFYNTKNVDELVSHITEKYSRCNLYCSRCFYRTCSQYSALQHIKIHVNVDSTKLFILSNIPSVLEDKEFKKITLRELPSLKCISKYRIGCQLIPTY